jgi:hypothetical protein
MEGKSPNQISGHRESKTYENKHQNTKMDVDKNDGYQLQEHISRSIKHLENTSKHKYHKLRHCKQSFCVFTGIISSKEMTTHMRYAHDVGGLKCPSCERKHQYSRKYKNVSHCRGCHKILAPPRISSFSKWAAHMDKDFKQLELKSELKSGLESPDRMYVSDTLIEIDECDELMHLYKPGTFRDEEERLESIYEELQKYVSCKGKNMVVIRFNPDSYNPLTGRSRVKLATRYKVHTQLKRYLRNNPPEHRISIYYLFYNEHSDKLTRNYPHKLIFGNQDFEYAYENVNMDKILSCKKCVSANISVDNGHIDCLKFHVNTFQSSYGANGFTIQRAIEGKHYECVEFLIGISNLRYTVEWLNNATENNDLRMLEAINLISDDDEYYYGSTNIRDKLTLLNRSARHNSLECMIYMLGGLRGLTGERILQLTYAAVRHDSLECLIYICQMNTDPEGKIQNLTFTHDYTDTITKFAFDCALELGSVRCISYLIDIRKFTQQEIEFSHTFTVNTVNILLQKGYEITFPDISRCINVQNVDVLRYILPIFAESLSVVQIGALLRDKSSDPATRKCVEAVCNKLKKSTEVENFLEQKFDVHSTMLYDIYTKIMLS